MKNKFQFLSYSGFHITTTGGKHILVDPYLGGNPHAPFGPDAFEQVDLILVSHGPFDHVGDTAEIALAHNCKIVCPFDVKRLMIDRGVPAENIIEMIWGVVHMHGDIRIKAIENHHRS
ncbi:MAG: MBL fold metallo-hydrolase, partial [Christensenellaceae bacterium]|nr:MBL fold metallo-hydrolase [Christensenellaceae bacterium]